MRKLEITEWIQLALMFPLVFWVIAFLSEHASLEESVFLAPEEGKCYLPLYTYQSEEPYLAALCIDSGHRLSIFRFYEGPDSYTSYNDAKDVVFISALFLGSVGAWLLFIFRRLWPCVLDLYYMAKLRQK